MKRLLAAVFAAFACSTQLFAFDVSPTQIHAGIHRSKKVTVSQEFVKKLLSSKSLFDNIEMISVTDDGKRLSSVRGNLSSPFSGNIAVAARDYISENADLFNLPADRDVDYLRLIRQYEMDGVSHLTWQMIIDGVFVRDATIELHVDKKGVVTLANGSLPDVKEIENQIVLSKYQAIGMARAAVQAEKFSAVPEAFLTIVAEDNGTAKMAYVTRMSVEKPLGDWEVIVDAENGSVMHINNEMNFNNGVGSVYVTNPLKCDVTNEKLYHLTTSTLTGKFAKIESGSGPTAVNEDNIHLYQIEDRHFDEVNMYKYITNIHDFFKKLGHDKLDRPMRTVVQYGKDYDNAFFSPWQNMLGFGTGAKFNNLAREAAVAYHEYAHAMLNSIKALTYSGESGAINEGQADYFGCSYTDDALIGEWVVAKMERPFLRNLENNFEYPKDIQGQVHADGRIWGGTLWDLRKALGKDVADLLIYRGLHYFNGTRPKFIDGYNGIVTADKNIFDGANIEKIDEVFARRGIVAANYNGAVLTAEDLKQMRNFHEAHNE